MALITLFLITMSLSAQNAQEKNLKRLENQLGFELSETNKAFYEATGLVKCASYELNKKLREEGKLSSNEEFEKIISKAIAKEKQDMANGKAAATVYTIPVVVHIYHKGEAIGTGTNLSVAAIESQITVLNQDFRRMTGTPGHNTHADGADTEIQFCLAKKDANGNATTGITRKQGVSGTYTTNAFNTEKPNTQWDPTKYLNIWVADLGTQLLGYAQFPHANSVITGMGGNYGGSTANTDGVVMGPNFFGSSALATVTGSAPYDKGRTTTHEVGHWLGLKHINGDSNCGDDNCADTPTQASQSNQQTACNPTTTCNSQDMIQNYMDYTNDSCMNIFTKDQTARMRAILNPANNIVNRGTLVEAGTTHTLCSTNPDYTITATNSPVTVCSPNNGVFNFTFATENGYNANTTLSVSNGLPANATATFNPTSISANGNFTLTIGNIANVASGNYTLTISADGSVDKTVDVVLNVASGTPGVPTLTAPANSATNQGLSVNLTWNSVTAASEYIVQRATDTGFTANLLSNTVTTNSYNATGLTSATQYFWRVKAKNGCGESNNSNVFNFTTATSSCNTYNSTQNNVAIPTSGSTAHVVTSTLNIPANVTITDVNITVNITHTYMDDLEVKLKAPDGTEVIIVKNAQCSDAGNDNIQATFDDQATGAINCVTGPPAIGGTVKPENALTPFNGKDSTGNWVLTVTDGYPSADGGSITNFSIEICGSPVLGIDDLEFNDDEFEDSFSLWPNPSNGKVAISFSNKSSNEEVILSLFDIRGRLISKQVFNKNTTIFNQEINFNDLQSAVYILKIKTGTNELFKRLVVE